jgi:hypothetical protein
MDFSALDPNGRASTLWAVPVHLDPYDRFIMAVSVVADQAGFKAPAITAGATELFFRNGLGRT